MAFYTDYSQPGNNGFEAADTNALSFFPSSYDQATELAPPATPLQPLSDTSNPSFSHLQQPTQQQTQQQPIGGAFARKINVWTGRYDDEPPLLLDLGIDFAKIYQRTSVVLNPTSKVDNTVMADADLAGPFVFALALGVFLLMAGKMQFSYIYGMGVVGCLGMYMLLNLMSVHYISLHDTTSILGYCLLPVTFLAGLGIILSVSGFIGFVLSLVAIGWCTKSATTMFIGTLNMHDRYAIVFYPVSLVYTCFIFLTIF